MLLVHAQQLHGKALPRMQQAQLNLQAPKKFPPDTSAQCPCWAWPIFHLIRWASVVLYPQPRKSYIFLYVEYISVWTNKKKVYVVAGKSVKSKVLASA